jgi:hypothetical protein
MLVSFFGSFFDPEDEGSKFIRNFAKCILHYTASHITDMDTSNLTLFIIPSGLIYSSILKIEIVYSSETSLDFYETHIYSKIEGSSLVTDVQTSNIALYKFPCVAYLSTLKMEELRSSETLLNFYHTARLHMAHSV